MKKTIYFMLFVVLSLSAAAQSSVYDTQQLTYYTAGLCNIAVTTWKDKGYTCTGCTYNGATYNAVCQKKIFDSPVINDPNPGEGTCFDINNGVGSYENYCLTETSKAIFYCQGGQVKSSTVSCGVNYKCVNANCVQTFSQVLCCSKVGNGFSYMDACPSSHFTVANENECLNYQRELDNQDYDYCLVNNQCVVASTVACASRFDTLEKCVNAINEGAGSVDEFVDDLFGGSGSTGKLSIFGSSSMFVIIILVAIAVIFFMPAIKMFFKVGALLFIVVIAGYWYFFLR